MVTTSSSGTPTRTSANSNNDNGNCYIVIPGGVDMGGDLCKKVKLGQYSIVYLYHFYYS